MARKRTKTANTRVAAARNGSAKAPSAAAAVEQADVALGKRLARRRHHPVVRAADKAAALGDQEPLYAAAAVMLAVGLASRNERLTRAAVAMLAAVAAADGAKRVVKHLVRRTRPNLLLDEGRYASGAGGTGRGPEQSFPSGHVAGSLAAALAVARRYPRAGKAGSVAALAVGVSRVVRGAHWPLDCAAGIAIGIGAEAASGRLLHRLGMPRH